MPKTDTCPPRDWPATQVEMWQVADLAPYAKNARQHPPEQIDQIAASMERFGFTIPMLVAEDGTIIAGHGRLMAALQLGSAPFRYKFNHRPPNGEEPNIWPKLPSVLPPIPRPGRHDRGPALPASLTVPLYCAYWRSK